MESSRGPSGGPSMGSSGGPSMGSSGETSGGASVEPSEGPSEGPSVGSSGGSNRGPSVGSSKGATGREREAQMSETILTLFLQFTSQYDLPPGLLQAICTAESNLDIDAVHMNDGGWGNHSLGICQVGYHTAIKLGMERDKRNCQASSIRKLAKCVLMQPEINIMYAAKYIAGQLARYHGNVIKSISAYNAGSYTKRNWKYVQRVQRNLRKEIQ